PATASARPGPPPAPPSGGSTAAAPASCSPPPPPPARSSPSSGPRSTASGRGQGWHKASPYRGAACAPGSRPPRTRPAWASPPPPGREGSAAWHTDTFPVIGAKPSGAPDSPYEVPQGPLPPAHSRLLLIGNPPRSDGYSPRPHPPGDWHRLKISAYDTPNFR